MGWGWHGCWGSSFGVEVLVLGVDSSVWVLGRGCMAWGNLSYSLISLKGDMWGIL